MLTNIDVLDVCAVMLQRCGLGAEHLAAHMARPELPSAAPPPEPAPPPIAREPGQPTPQQQRILEMCRPEDGSTVPAMERAMGLSTSTVCHHLYALDDLGLITRVKVAGIRAAHYFADPSHAVAWAEAQRPVRPAPEPKPAAPRKQGRAGAELVVRSGTASPAAAAKPVLRGEGVIPDGVRITVAPTPAPRYGVAADAVLTGGFSTSRPGINPLTGEAW